MQKARVILNTEEARNFRFIRKAVVGSYKDDMSADIIKTFDNWIQNNLEGLNFRFKE